MCADSSEWAKDSQWRKEFQTDQLWWDRTMLAEQAIGDDDGESEGESDEDGSGGNDPTDPFGDDEMMMPNPKPTQFSDPR